MRGWVGAWVLRICTMMVSGCGWVGGWVGHQGFVGYRFKGSSFQGFQGGSYESWHGPAAGLQIQEGNPNPQNSNTQPTKP